MDLIAEKMTLTTLSTHHQFNRIVFFMILFSSMMLNPCYSQEGWSQLFYDDFEDGTADKWMLHLESDDASWDVTEDNGGFVLTGLNWNSASPLLNGSNPWSDYSFSFSLKLIEKHAFILFRSSEMGNYFLSFGVSMLTLTNARSLPESESVLLKEYYEDFSLNTWYDFEIIVKDSTIKILMDDELKIDLKDPNPLLYGDISFNTQPASQISIDDVLIFGDSLDYNPHEPKEPNRFISTLPGYTWIKSGGPNGGLGYDIRIHPGDKDIMFVTDNPSGVNKSIDGGATWTQKNDGIAEPGDQNGLGAPIFSLTIDPSTPSIVWAGTQDVKGIYRSDDCGETWIKKINGIEEGDEITFRGFAIHPNNSNIILAAGEVPGRNHPLMGGLKKGFIYKSVDGGDYWYKVWSGESLARVLLFDYKHTDTLYCSTGIFDAYPNNANPEMLEQGGEGVLKSIDGGESWFNINNGLENLSVGFLEMHPTNPEILYAAAGDGFFCQEEYGGYEGAIYKTVDGGENWQVSLGTGLAYFSVVTISKSNPDVVYAGHDNNFYRSNDAGEVWVKHSKPDRTPWGPPGISGGIPISATVDPDNPDVVFVNSYSGGNYKSIDGAQSWINSSKGYSGARVHDVVVDPKNPSYIYSSGFSGPFYSRDGGDYWEGMQYNTHIANPVKLVINPSDNQDMITSNGGYAQLFRSKNRGKHWENVLFYDEMYPDYDGIHHFKAISYAPSAPDIVYAGLRCLEGNPGFEPIASRSYGMFKSSDSGDNWLRVNNGLENTLLNINCIVVHPADPDIVFIATGFDGIYKSENGGESWIRKSNGLTSAKILCLTMDRNDPDILYAGSGDGKGVFKSLNGGELWMEYNNNILLECPAYLSPVGNSPDGISFEKSSPVSQVYGLFGDIPWTRILDIEIDPTNSDNVYLADDHSGIYVSNDAGESWWLINEGLNVLNPTSITISSDGEILYAGTGSGGVFRMVLGGNKEPMIKATIPIAADTLNLLVGDSLQFEIEAFDFNQDTLSYQWFLNNDLIEDDNHSRFLLRTDQFVPDYFNLHVAVSDNDTSISLNWILRVNVKTNEQITICPGDDYNGWTEAGEYERVLTTVNGTDSIIITNLSLHSSFTPEISVSGDTLSCEQEFVSFQWFDSNGLIEGATSRDFTVTLSGDYYLVVTDLHDCTHTSSIKSIYISSIFDGSIENFRYSIIPNPNEGIFSFRVDSNYTNQLKLTLININGQIVEVRNLNSATAGQVELFDFSHLGKGIYQLLISSEFDQQSEKIVIK
jgi:photosystem II stability/assembly factor-like uncharacterized protein